MDRTFSFEKLTVWLDARRFCMDIYTLSQAFPKHEKFAMCSQIRRAAISVCTNIAEGSSRSSSKEKARFIEMAYSSLLEVLCLIIIAKEANYIDSQRYSIVRKKSVKIGYKLYKLKNAYLIN